MAGAKCAIYFNRQQSEPLRCAGSCTALNPGRPPSTAGPAFTSPSLIAAHGCSGFASLPGVCCRTSTHRLGPPLRHRCRHTGRTLLHAAFNTWELSPKEGERLEMHHDGRIPRSEGEGGAALGRQPRGLPACRRLDNCSRA